MPIELTAGPLAMQWDDELGFLRTIRLGDAEIIRGVFAAIRDADWNTIGCRIDDVDVCQSDDSFELRFRATANDPAVPYHWLGRIEGRASGQSGDPTVVYQFDGVADGPFQKNRIGVCLLHPLATCLGNPVEVLHSDGTTSHGEFPHRISPHQPANDIRAITYRTGDLRVRVDFEGEVFEMEDQRNWTDASFKTYSTPLDLPFPLAVKTGDRVRHRITITASDSHGHTPIHTVGLETDAIVCRVDWDSLQPRPKVGLGLATSDAVPDAVVKRLKAMQPDHLRVDLRMDHPDWQSAAERASDLAKSQ
ncbi:MAG: hypothetical protein AAGA03_20070, partial [Planctomycetota bacterium]